MPQTFAITPLRGFGGFPNFYPKGLGPDLPL
jgi:hypothetical protein